MSPVFYATRFVLQVDPRLSLGVVLLSDHPYKDQDHHVYISNVVKGGLAHSSGRFQAGDKIIYCNGADFSNIDHATAIKLIKVSSHLTSPQ
jgi:hypothetical protein